jgi:hypothetical protein
VRFVRASAPLSGLLPVQPPEAVHPVALVEDQLSVELPPLATVVGVAVSATVGGDDGVTVTMTD